MSNDARESSPRALYISRIDVKFSEHSRKRAKDIKLQTRNKTLKDFDTTSIALGSDHSETFIPAIELQFGDLLSVSVRQNRIMFRYEEVKITMNYREILSGRQEKGRIQMYQKTEKRIDAIISISFHLFRPATHDIIDRFRILIIGNSGVGKSSLINKMFDVQGVDVANYERGAANIDIELVSSKNGCFLFHDSTGFEEGDTDNIEIVKQFVARHRNQPQIEDRLHAVWLCLEIPYSGGRFIESGVEDFLRRRQEVLGDIPLVTVLTKVDLLDNQVEIEMLENDADDKTFEQRKSEFLEEHCIQHLRAAAGDVPHVIVSTRVPHPTMFANVIKITKESVNKYIANTAAATGLTSK